MVVPLTVMVNGLSLTIILISISVPPFAVVEATVPE
jgi:hypothetical protein